MLCQEAKDDFVNDNQTKPSVNCCNAKNNGMLAKSKYDFDFTFLIATTPATQRTELATKLASVEKHISLNFYARYKKKK